MAQFYRPKKTTVKRQRINAQPVVGLDHQGRGIVRHQGQSYFVAGVVPGDEIDYTITGKHQATCERIRQSSEQRVAPPCKYYQQCGGCDLQHLSVTDQRAHKQRVVGELLQKYGAISATEMLPIIAAEGWHYRQRARLAVHWNPRQQKLTLGFRAKQSKTIIAVEQCLTLSAALSELLRPLQHALAQLDLVKQLGHVELIDATVPQVLLHLHGAVTELSAADQLRLMQLSEQQQLQVWWRVGEALPSPLSPEQELPRYPSASGSIEFYPGDFLQANAALNLQLVETAVAWLDPNTSDQILECFAGAGNFSLKIAASGAQLTAVEGVPSMVERLQAQAQQRGLNIKAVHADLDQPWRRQKWAQAAFNKAFLDPARAGARQVCEELTKAPAVDTIVYVSCAPDTFARDAGVLQQGGFTLRKVQVVDMFPQTHHIELIGLFSKE